MQGSSKKGAFVWEIFLIPTSSQWALLMHHVHLSTSGRHLLTLHPLHCERPQLPQAVWNEGKCWVIKGIQQQLRYTKWNSKEMLPAGRGKAVKPKHGGTANDTGDKMQGTEGFSTVESQPAQTHGNLPVHNFSINPGSYRGVLPLTFPFGLALCTDNSFQSPPHQHRCCPAQLGGKQAQT